MLLVNDVVRDPVGDVLSEAVKDVLRDDIRINPRALPNGPAKEQVPIPVKLVQNPKLTMRFQYALSNREQFIIWIRDQSS